MTSADPESLRATAATFRLAARTYATEVDPPFYQALLDLCGQSGLASVGLNPLGPDLQSMAPDDAMTELAVEYCRLFIGPRPVCPPYASARRSGTALGIRAQRTLHTFLHDYDLQPDLPAGAPIAADDHIAVTFALFDRLYTAAAAVHDPVLSPDVALGAIRELSETYATTWVPDFLHEVRTQSHCGPYGPIARLTSMVLP